MSGFIINESTSVLQIQTSGLQAGAAAIVYVSTTATPGQLVTVKDSMGFLSTPQSILLSTTGGASLLDPAGGPPQTSSLIRQAFGYQTLVADSAGSGWTLVNVYPFSDPAANYNLKSLVTNTARSGSGGTTIGSFLSTLHTQIAADVTTSNVNIFSALYASTLVVNSFTDFLSTAALNNRSIIGGNMKIYGSTVTTGSILVRE